MNRFQAFLLVMLITSVGCSGESDAPPVVGGMVTQQGTGYEISVPANWEVQRSYMGTDILALSPLESADDSFRENINVVIEEIPTGMSLAEYYNKNVDAMKNLLVDFDPGDDEGITIAGRFSRKLRYAHSAGDLELDAAAYFIAVGNRGYTVTCSSVPGTFDRYEEIFQSIVNSFTLQ